MPFPFRALRVLLPLGLVAALGGCGSGDEVKSYNVPKEATGKAGPAVGGGGGGGGMPATGDYRILGAMLPADNPAWFFKLTGRADELAKHEADFDKFISSIRLGGGNPEYVLPAGWTRGGPRGTSFVKITDTIKLPGAGLEITVIAASGGVLGNVERWAGQVGMVAGPDLMRNATRTFDAGNGKGLRVDVRGSKNPTGGPMMGGK